MENVASEVRKPAVKLSKLLSAELLREMRNQLLEAHKLGCFNTFELDNGAVWCGVEFDFPDVGIKATRKCGFVVYEPEKPFVVSPTEKAKYDLAIKYCIEVQGMEQEKAEKSARNLILKARKASK